MIKSKSLHRFLVIFSIYRDEKPTDIRWAIGLAVFMGALYGSFVDPFWSEPVAFGQAWAGIVDYSRSPYGPILFGDPSLQITLPALLLRAGVGIWPLSLIAGAFFSALAFSAVAATTFVITRNIIVSLAMTLAILTYIFASSHGYPIVYPTGQCAFGQTGFYLCLLAMSLAAYGCPLLAGIFGGVLGGVHAVWCVCFVLGVFPAILCLQPKSLKQLTSGFVIALGCALAVQHFGVASLPQQPVYSAPSIPSDALAEAYVHASQSQSEELNLGVVPLSKKPKIHKSRSPHNVLFSDSDNPLTDATIFFFPSIMLLLLCVSFYRFLRHTPAFMERWTSIKKLLLIVAIPLMSAGIFKIIEEFDPTLRIISMIDSRLPDLVFRAIVTRWFNLSSLLIPIFIVGLLWMLACDKKSWSAFAALVALFLWAFGWFSTSSWSIVPIWFSTAPFSLTPPPIVFSPITFIELFLVPFSLMAVWACLFLESRLFKGSSDADYLRGSVLAILFVLFILINLNHFLHKVLNERRYTGSDHLDMLAAAAKADSGPLLISPGVLYANNFMPQLRTGRPIIIPAQLDVYAPKLRKVIHVFCYTDPYQRFVQFYENIKPCFEQRSPQEWAVIRHETSATGIMTPENWHLKIPLTMTGGGFNYYRIPSEL